MEKFQIRTDLALEARERFREDHVEIPGVKIDEECRKETDIRIVAKNILETRDRLNRILAANTGKPIEQINEDTERDNYMTAEQAKEYGLIDNVVEKRN